MSYKGDDDDVEIIVRRNQFPSLPFRDFYDSDMEMSPAYKRLATLYFYNQYPTIPKTNINRILEEYKFHLFPAYMIFAAKREMSSGERVVVVVGDQFVIFCPPRNQEFFLPKSDMVFYQEYCYVEEKRLWDLDKKKSAESHETLVRQQKLIGRKVVECPLCYEDYLWTEIIRCSNREHFCCPDCIIQFIDERMAENKPSRGCFETGCTGGIDISDLSKVLGNQKFARFENAEKEKLLQQSKNKQLSHCPVCHYVMYFDKVASSSSSLNNDDDDEETLCVDEASLVRYPVFDCPKCLRKTCRRCRVLDHRPKLCLGEDIESEDALIRYVTNAMSEARIRHCPWCKTPGIMIDTCNMVPCKSCSHFYCYNCEWKIDDNNHYRHFGGVDGKGVKENDCPLYYKGGVVEADRQRVVKKAEEAIVKWRKRHPRYMNVDEAKLRQIINSGL